jgi:hypothetical protein
VVSVELLLVATSVGKDMLDVIKQWVKALADSFVSVATTSTPSEC